MKPYAIPTVWCRCLDGRTHIVPPGRRECDHCRRENERLAMREIRDETRKESGRVRAMR